MRFSTGGDFVRRFKADTKFVPDKLAILKAVWEKEIGSFRLDWRLRGVKGGLLFIAVDSAPAAHELKMKSTQIVRNLNKHFRGPWIKGIRVEQ